MAVTKGKSAGQATVSEFDAPLTVHESVTSWSGIVEAPAFLLVFVVSGRAIVHFAEESVLVREGTVVALPRGAEGVHENLRSLRAVSWVLKEEFIAAHAKWMPPAHPLSPTILAALETPPRPGRAQLHENSLRVVRELLLQLAALERGNVLSHYDRLARTAEILALLDPRRHRQRENPRIPTSKRYRNEIGKALYLLEASIDHPWTIPNLAAAVALSPAQLSRLFRELLDVPPGAYLWRRRIEVMAELLTNSEITVAEAARQTGWQSRSAASRAFRRLYGASPREFAKHDVGLPD